MSRSKLYKFEKFAPYLGLSSKEYNAELIRILNRASVLDFKIDEDTQWVTMKDRMFNTFFKELKKVFYKGLMDNILDYNESEGVSAEDIMKEYFQDVDTVYRFVNSQLFILTEPMAEFISDVFKPYLVKAWKIASGPGARIFDGTPFKPDGYDSWLEVDRSNTDRKMSYVIEAYIDGYYETEGGSVNTLDYVLGTSVRFTYEQAQVLALLILNYQ